MNKRALVVLAGVLSFEAGCRDADGGSEKHPPRPRRVKVRKISKKVFDRDAVVDVTFVPSERVLLGPSVPGRIRRINKKEGYRIKEGEVLVVVSPKEVYIQTIPLRAQLSAAMAKRDAADAVLEKLDEPYQRAKKLHSEGAISKVDLDEIAVKHTAAKAERDAAAKTAKKLRTELRRAYGKLADAKLRAPFDGFVVRRLADEGEVARPFPPTIVLVVTRHQPILAEGHVPEHVLVHIEKGIDVEVGVSVLPGKSYSGKLTTIRPQIDPITRTAMVRVEVPNRDLSITPGMTGEMTIDLPDKRALAIRRSELAARPSEGKGQVFVVKKGRVELRDIEIGSSLDVDWVEVLSGLKPGDTVASNEQSRLKPGDRITPVGGRGKAK
jgi:RND family efflux transporter MFP subunit